MGRIIAAATSLSLIAVGLFSIMTAAKTSPANSSQEKEKKAPVLRWDPPHVGAPVPSLSATPSCFLPDVLKQAGQRAEELVDHLQKFIAHEQISKQTDRACQRYISHRRSNTWLILENSSSLSVKSRALNVEIWLPKFAVAYTDYADRRMIIEHTFSDFQFFSVQTQETIQKPSEP